MAIVGEEFGSEIAIAQKFEKIKKSGKPNRW